jgi:hypothetical protein
MFTVDVMFCDVRAIYIRVKLFIIKIGCSAWCFHTLCVLLHECLKPIARAWSDVGGILYKVQTLEYRSMNLLNEKKASHIYMA